MNPFRAHYEYGSVENCITRLEICIKPLLLLKRNNDSIHEYHMNQIYEDSTIFYDENDMPTVPKVEGELLERAKNVYRDLLELGVFDD